MTLFLVLLTLATGWGFGFLTREFVDLFRRVPPIRGDAAGDLSTHAGSSVALPAGDA